MAYTLGWSVVSGVRGYSPVGLTSSKIVLLDVLIIF